MKSRLTEMLQIEVPVIGGAMYPCSNPELVAAISEAGGMGVLQPLSLTYVWGYSFREGLQKIKSLTQKPFGMNALLEKSSRVYERRMLEWIEIALEEGCRFFVTALGNPKSVCERVHSVGGKVFHDVTERKWALKALDAQVDGLICVNRRAGGHAGIHSAEELMRELSHLGLPLICAGGVGSEHEFLEALSLGYEGVQMGTRFIATRECFAPEEYKQAIVKARESDIVLTERVTGIPLSVIRTPFVDQIGTHAGPVAKWLLKNRSTKEWMRLFYNLKALSSMKASVRGKISTKDYWQAGKSVDSIHTVESVDDVLSRFKSSYRSFDLDRSKLSPI